MKHAEAENYVCPQSLAAGHQHGCLGMRCAAWRWAEPKWGAPEQRRGHCGLGGIPKHPVNPEHEKA